MERLINEFREWQRGWDLYETSDRKRPSPQGINEFIDNLKKLYKVEILK